MKYPFRLDPSSKKFKCPGCGKRRFVRYIDAKNQYQPETKGRCDRPSCGYFVQPDKLSDDDWKKNQTPFIPPKPKPISYINKDAVLLSMKCYLNNGLYRYLAKRYTTQEVQGVFRLYNLGTAKKWDGSTVFWQNDYDGKFRSGKIIKYSEQTGKRVKDPKALITWAHKLLRLNDFNLKQVVFGEHLLRGASDDSIICLVESEKTALICALECPEFIWLATGSSNMFKADSLTKLKGKKVIAFPDTDLHDSWKTKALEIAKKLNLEITVSDLLLNQKIDSDYSEGFDLADLILNSKTL
ncbi:MAG: hypothetical protein ACI8XB_002935 [Patiriisocius sp.]|jgi:hypothetical protein